MGKTNIAHSGYVFLLPAADEQLKFAGYCYHHRVNERGNLPEMYYPFSVFT
ncbi:hypothetical protein JXO59_08020 [candidate division KSB1 bacterium]|nr:hypothetical protein [candidate division KSB1 bacterium]